jgi:hypothetical protein
MTLLAPLRYVLEKALLALFTDRKTEAQKKIQGHASVGVTARIPKACAHNTTAAILFG